MVLHSPEFAVDPHSVYRNMRRDHGPLVPVEISPGIAATLVVGYTEALQILGDPDHFPADPRHWRAGVPASCPVLPTMEWQPNALRTAGEAHVRYRTATTACLDRVDLYGLQRTVERTAVSLINSFCETGMADLLGQYAIPLAVEILEEVLGLSPEVGEKAFDALIMQRNAPDPASVESGAAMLTSAILEMVEAKKQKPGADITSWLLADPIEMGDAEVVAQVAAIYAMGTEPTWNLIANTLRLMLTDDRFGSELLGGALATRDAIDEVLFTDPPLANTCLSYPRQPQVIGGAWLPVNQPVLISLAACNNDPAVHGDRTGNRSHLAWSAGAHACPAQSVAMVIVQEALDQLLDALPEIELAVPAERLQWRPGGLHRALAALPVKFAPSPPLNIL